MARGPGIALVSPRLARAGFAHGFSSGDGAAPPPDFALLRDPVRLEAALRAFAAATGFEREAIWQCTQVHGTTVVEAGADAAPSAPSARRLEADALVARAGAGAGAEPSTPPRAVGVRVADCVPVLLADPRHGHVAAVHAGWKGLVAGVVEAAVAALVGLGSARGDLLAAVGPSIGPCCFEVGLPVAERLEAAAPAGSNGTSVVRSRHERDGVARAMVDLRRATRTLLEAAGVAGDRVDDVPGCSRCDPRFHSFRRDGDASGRMLAAIQPSAR